jgi:osmoprotectant transport system permease protein
MSSRARFNPVLILLAGLILLALLSLPFLRVAPNRLVSGEPVYFFSLLAGPSWLLAILPCALLLSGLVRQSRALLIGVLLATSALAISLLWLAASQAALQSQAESSIARVSLGSAFWVAVLLSALTTSNALQRMQAAPLYKAVFGLVFAAIVCLMFASGLCDNLSIMKEYANRADGFLEVVLRHLQIAGVAMALTVVIGLTLGWATHTYKNVANLVFPVLNVVQTIPSIALFGLLMAPLAWMAARWPAMDAAGISGVGLAPAVIALTLYGLLPVVRSTLAGLQQISIAQINAARALGLRPLAVLRHVAVPLALPVVLGGVRTAAVAAVGLAAVTALIGAGGLGSIMFEGLFSNAQDVVLLGVLPIIALGVVVDAIFNVLVSLAVRQARPHDPHV